MLHLLEASPGRWTISTKRPTPATTWSKACVCEHLFAGVAGSNPAGGMDFCLL